MRTTGSVQQRRAGRTWRLWLLAAMTGCAVWLAVPGLTQGALASGPPYLELNGERVSGEEPAPLLVSGETMWGVRALLAPLGGDVQWQGNRARVDLGGRSLEFVSGESRWLLDGRQRDLSVSLFEREGTLYIPVREVIEALGGDYSWDERSLTAQIEVSALGGALSISSPSDGDVLDPTALNIAGQAPGRRAVRVTVSRGTRVFLFGTRWSQVAEEAVTSDGRGRWQVRVSLGRDASGSYKAVAQLLTSRGQVEAERQVQFRVGGARLTITQPTDGDTVTGDRVQIAGETSASRDVRVRVYGGRNEAISDETVVSNRNGHWQTDVALSTGSTLQAGSYRIVAELLGDNRGVDARQEVTFRVNPRSGPRGRN